MHGSLYDVTSFLDYHAIITPHEIFLKMFAYSSGRGDSKNPNGIKF